MSSHTNIRTYYATSHSKTPAYNGKDIRGTLLIMSSSQPDVGTPILLDTKNIQYTVYYKYE
jgi:hypothetical protein